MIFVDQDYGNGATAISSDLILEGGKKLPISPQRFPVTTSPESSTRALASNSSLLDSWNMVLLDESLLTKVLVERRRGKL